MPGVLPRFGAPNSGSQISHTAIEAVIGGQLVERRVSALSRAVGVAAAGSLRVRGVAQHDVPAAATHIGGPVVNEEHGLTVFRNVVIPVTFTAAATGGDRLIAAAAGQVTPAGLNPDARTLVGEAFDDVAAGAVGLAYIY